MSSMNLLNIKKEIQNLNNIVCNLKNENSDLRNQIKTMNEELLDYKIKNPMKLN